MFSSKSDWFISPPPPPPEDKHLQKLRENALNSYFKWDILIHCKNVCRYDTSLPPGKPSTLLPNLAISWFEEFSFPAVLRPWLPQLSLCSFVVEWRHFLYSILMLKPSLNVRATCAFNSSAWDLLILFILSVQRFLIIFSKVGNILPLFLLNLVHYT